MRFFQDTLAYPGRDDLDKRSRREARRGHGRATPLPRYTPFVSKASKGEEEALEVVAVEYEES
jgi:hypothetical protein